MSAATTRSVDPTSSELGQIIQMLREIVETQMVHTSMLKRMLDAATKPLDEPSPTAHALRALAASTNTQTEAMQALMRTMAALPDQISAGMRAEVDRSLTEF